VCTAGANLFNTASHLLLNEEAAANGGQYDPHSS
jgi:hypothetical protein